MRNRNFNDVSVVIPACNAGRFLGETLASIAAADLRGIRLDVTVMDDASTDNTAAVARAALQQTALPGKVVTNPDRLGAGDTRRLAIESAPHDLIVFVDADDLVRPNRFADAIRTHVDTGAILVGGDLMPFDDALGPNCGRHRRISLPMRPDQIAAAALFHCPVWAGVTSFSRSSLRAIELPTDAFAEDWILAQRVISCFGANGVANTGTVLIDHRRYPQQATAAAGVDMVYPAWREVLSKLVRLEPSAEELFIHGKCSPYHFSDVPALTPEEFETWFAWAEKILDAAEQRDFVPLAVSRMIHTITQLLIGAAHTRGRLTQAQLVS